MAINRRVFIAAALGAVAAPGPLRSGEPVEPSWAPVRLSAADQQFLEARAFAIEEIAAVYRVPLRMVKSTSRRGT